MAVWIENKYMHFDHHCFQLNWDFAIAFFPTLWEWSFKKASTHILADETIVLSQVGKKDLKCPASMPTQRWCPHFDKKKTQMICQIWNLFIKRWQILHFLLTTTGWLLQAPRMELSRCHHHHHHSSLSSSSWAIFIIVIIIIMLQVFRVPSDLFSGNPMEKNMDTPLVSLPEQARRIETVIMILPLWSVDFIGRCNLGIFFVKTFHQKLIFRCLGTQLQTLCLRLAVGKNFISNFHHHHFCHHHHLDGDEQDEHQCVGLVGVNQPLLMGWTWGLGSGGL